MAPRLSERLFVTVALLANMGVIDGLTRQYTQQAGLEILSDRAPFSAVLLQIGIYIWGLALIAMRWKQVLVAVRKVWPLVAFVALAPVSTLWSVQPRLTIQRSALLLVTSLFAIYLGERYSIEELATMFAKTLCLMMLAVIAIHFISPGFVVDQRFAYADDAHRGGWRGLSEHKNLFGQYMVLAIALLMIVRFRRLPWLRYAFLLSAAGLLVLSRSANALACGVLVAAAIPLWRLTRLDRGRRALAYSTIALLLGLAVFLVWVNTDFIFDVLGRDSTMTGRTQIWSMVVSAILNHPILGYGYGAFWDALRGETLNVWISVGFVARGAHNGYLDMLLSFGLIGVPFFLLLFLRSIRMAIDYFRSEPGRIGLWPITYLCFFALQNITESGLMQSWRSLPFLMFATIVASLTLRNRPSLAVEQVPAIQHLPTAANGYLVDDAPMNTWGEHSWNRF